MFRLQTRYLQAVKYSKKKQSQQTIRHHSTSCKEYPQLHVSTVLRAVIGLYCRNM